MPLPCNTVTTRRRAAARFLRCGVLLAAAALLCGPAGAREYYATPDGAGKRTGADWDNAVDRHAMVTLLAEAVAPGDRVLLGSGEYRLIDHHGTKTIRLLRGGRDGAPVVLEGVDTGAGLPQIIGRYDVVKNRGYHAHCYNGIAIGEGVSHVRIARLRIRRYLRGVRTAGEHVKLAVEDVDVRGVREGFRLAGVGDSTFRRCVAAGYTKRGMRFESGCRHLLVADSEADATGGERDWKTENFPFGFAVESKDSNHHIRFERCTARNNLRRGGPKDYWNGDGFTAEGAAHHISYDRCAAFDNADGGWDNKSRASSMARCVAAGNKRNFRVWNSDGDADHPTTLTGCLGVNPVLRGGTGGALSLWVRGQAVAERCTFVGGDGPAVGLAAHDDRTVKLIARRCIIVAGDGDPVRREEGTTYTAIECATGDPRFRAPSPDWRGTPAGAYDALRFRGEKGYHRADAAR